MVATSDYLIDVLNGLLDAEVNNLFRVVADASPHVAQAEANVREPIVELRHLSQRHARELSELIVRRGGVPRVHHDVRPADQNLSFLSLKFLLPKLVAEKDLILTRYENAKARIGSEYPEVVEALGRIEGEQRHYLDVLGRAAEAVTGGKYQPPSHEQPTRPARGR